MQKLERSRALLTRHFINIEVLSCTFFFPRRMIRIFNPVSDSSYLSLMLIFIANVWSVNCIGSKLKVL